MRLVEVVMLMGAHCVSPVEHGQMITEVAKVQCAVVIKKDRESGAVTVTPREAARDPQVAAAMARFGAASVDPTSDDVIRIVPARAPAGAPATDVKAKPIVPPPALQADATAATVQDAPAASPPRLAAPVIVTPPVSQEAAAPVKKVATLTAPPPRASAPAKPKATAKKVEKAAASRPAPRCKAGATAKWYTTADGQKKFRCMKPGGAPAQLY